MARNPVKYSVVDAFTDSAFQGNPAAVCFLEEEKDDQWLQSVTAEFNMPVTCYLTRIADSDSESSKPRFRLRWFGPVAEVKICGHATLAAAHFLFRAGLVDSDTIEFLTLSGILSAKRVPDQKIGESLLYQNGVQDDFSVELNFPVVPLVNSNDEASAISKVLNGASVVDIKKTAGDDFLVILPSWKDVEDFQPKFAEIQKCPGRGMIITALAPPGSEFDFFSRFFSPKLGVNEDHVCGSAHCALMPYWCKKLGKCDFVAYQASPRGGFLNLHLDEKNKRVLLRGKAITVTEALHEQQTATIYLSSRRYVVKGETRFRFDRSKMDQPAVAAKKCILKVNIHCRECKGKVDRALRKVDGVYSVGVDGDAGIATVIGNMDPFKLIKALKKKGKFSEILQYMEALPDPPLPPPSPENNQNPPNQRASEQASTDQHHVIDQIAPLKDKMKQVELTHSNSLKVTFKDSGNGSGSSPKSNTVAGDVQPHHHKGGASGSGSSCSVASGSFVQDPSIANGEVDGSYRCVSPPTSGCSCTSLPHGRRTHHDMQQAPNPMAYSYHEVLDNEHPDGCTLM